MGQIGVQRESGYDSPGLTGEDAFGVRATGLEPRVPGVTGAGDKEEHDQRHRREGSGLGAARLLSGCLLTLGRRGILALVRRESFERPLTVRGLARGQEEDEGADYGPLRSLR